MRDVVAIKKDSWLNYDVWNKTNLYALMFMFVGILSLIIISIMLKTCKVSVRRLAIVFPILLSLSFSGQLAICFFWWNSSAEVPDPNDDPKDDARQEFLGQLCEYLLESFIYVSAVFMIGYWPVCYIAAWKVAPKTGQSISCGIINAGACLVGFIVYKAAYVRKMYIDPNTKTNQQFIE